MWVVHTKKGVVFLTVANVLYWVIIVYGFELQSFFYVYFRINTPEKGMEPLILAIYIWVKQYH